MGKGSTLILLNNFSAASWLTVLHLSVKAWSCARSFYTGVQKNNQFSFIKDSGNLDKHKCTTTPTTTTTTTTTNNNNNNYYDYYYCYCFKQSHTV